MLPPAPRRGSTGGPISCSSTPTTSPTRTLRRSGIRWCGRQRLIASRRKGSCSRSRTRRVRLARPRGRHCSPGAISGASERRACSTERCLRSTRCSPTSSRTPGITPASSASPGPRATGERAACSGIPSARSTASAWSPNRPQASTCGITPPTSTTSWRRDRRERRSYSSSGLPSRTATTSLASAFGAAWIRTRSRCLPTCPTHRKSVPNWRITTTRSSTMTATSVACSTHWSAWVSWTTPLWSSRPTMACRSAGPRRRYTMAAPACPPPCDGVTGCAPADRSRTLSAMSTGLPRSWMLPASGRFPAMTDVAS